MLEVLKKKQELWLEEWVTVFITDLQCRPSAYEVRRVIYNVDYRSDCLWESCAFNTTGLKGKTERKKHYIKNKPSSQLLFSTPTFPNILFYKPGQNWCWWLIVFAFLCQLPSLLFYFSPASLSVLITFTHSGSI